MDERIIKMDRKEIGSGDMDWIHLDRRQWRFLVNTVVTLRVS
jgi:hypothetical protein